MTEDQRKQYEEAARKYLEDCPYDTDEKLNVFAGIIEGTKIAHSKIDEAERAILSDVFTVIENQQTLSMDDAEYKALETVKEELKRLRK